MRLFVFCRKNPVGCTISSTTVGSADAERVRRPGTASNSIGVTELTISSVHWADRIVAAEQLERRFVPERAQLDRRSRGTRRPGAPVDGGRALLRSPGSRHGRKVASPRMTAPRVQHGPDRDVGRRAPRARRRRPAPHRPRGRPRGGLAGRCAPAPTSACLAHRRGAAVAALTMPSDSFTPAHRQLAVAAHADTRPGRGSPPWSPRVLAADATAHAHGVAAGHDRADRDRARRTRLPDRPAPAPDAGPAPPARRRSASPTAWTSGRSGPAPTTPRGCA